MTVASSRRSRDGRRGTQGEAQGHEDQGRDLGQRRTENEWSYERIFLGQYGGETKTHSWRGKGERGYGACGGVNVYPLGESNIASPMVVRSIAFGLCTGQ